MFPSTTTQPNLKKKRAAADIFIPEDVRIALCFTGVRDYVESALKSVHNRDECVAILTCFLSLKTEDSGAWFSWLNAPEGVKFLNEAGLNASRRSFYRAVANLKKTGIIREVLPHTWKNKPTIEGQCAVYLIDPVLVSELTQSGKLLEPGDEAEAISLAKRSSRRTKNSPNRELYETSRHLTRSESGNADDQQEAEEDPEELERRYFEREEELEAERRANEEMGQAYEIEVDEDELERRSLESAAIAEAEEETTQCAQVQWGNALDDEGSRGDTEEWASAC